MSAAIARAAQAPAGRQDHPAVLGAPLKYRIARPDLQLERAVKSTFLQLLRDFSQESFGRHDPSVHHDARWRFIPIPSRSGSSYLRDADHAAGRMPKSFGLSIRSASVYLSSAALNAARPSCRMPRSRQLRVMRHWLPSARHSTSAKSGSVARTTSPRRILRGGFASVSPPERPRTAFKKPALVKVFVIFMRCAREIS